MSLSTINFQILVSIKLILILKFPIFFIFFFPSQSIIYQLLSLLKTITLTNTPLPLLSFPPSIIISTISSLTAGGAGSRSWGFHILFFYLFIAIFSIYSISSKIIISIRSIMSQISCRLRSKSFHSMSCFFIHICFFNRFSFLSYNLKIFFGLWKSFVQRRLSFCQIHTLSEIGGISPQLTILLTIDMRKILIWIHRYFIISQGTLKKGIRII